MRQGGAPHAVPLGWGALSGVAGGGGLLVFYRALAKGPMSVVAPVSGLMAALVPAVVGVARGDRLSPVAITGIALCLVAICFVSVERSAGPMRLGDGPVLAVIAGASFGAFFVFIRLGDDGTLWPLTISKVTGVAVVAIVALAARRGPRAVLRDRRVVAIALLAGTLDVLGNALYVLAARAGMLSVAGVLSSLYPASTVLLARFVHGETAAADPAGRPRHRRGRSRASSPPAERTRHRRDARMSVPPVAGCVDQRMPRSTTMSECCGLERSPADSRAAR